MEVINHELINLDSLKRIVNAPVNLGLTRTFTEAITNSTHAAGTITVSCTVVPANQIWVLESVASYDSSASTPRMVYLITTPATLIDAIYGVGAGVWYTKLFGQITMSPGDRLRFDFGGTALNSTLIVQIKYRIIDLVP